MKKHSEPLKISAIKSQRTVSSNERENHKKQQSHKTINVKHTKKLDSKNEEKEGKDELYVDVCLRKNAELVDEYGSEIPEHKTKEVKAYMNAWDLTRGSDFQKSSLEEKKRFIDIYVNVFMNASYPENPKAIPWDRFDDFVLDIAKRRFKGENVDVEPRTLDTLLKS